MNIAIVGGGISGMYLAYLLSKKRIPSIIIESTNRLGGRIYTHRDSHLGAIEAGAGRFLLSHKRLVRLLKEFNLYDKCTPISPSFHYLPAINDIPKTRPESIHKSHIDNLVQRVIRSSKRRSYTFLRKIVFLDYISTVLDPHDTQLLYDSFGYSTELDVMNAYDAILMIENHLAKRNFYVLSGGLDQLVRMLERRLIDSTYVTILRKCPIENIVNGGAGGYTLYARDGFRMDVDRCICAVPAPIMRKWTAFAPCRDALDTIVCAPLCRIYSAIGDAHGIRKAVYSTKFTTNTDIKMYIPIHDNIAMISYTDNDYARKWKRLYDEGGGTKRLNRELQKELSKTLGENVPLPKHTKLFYWDCGVGYWGINADTRKFDLEVESGLYMCGENVSVQNQQWIEGALDTAEEIYRRLV